MCIFFSYLGIPSIMHPANSPQTTSLSVDNIQQTVMILIRHTWFLLLLLFTTWCLDSPKNQASPFSSLIQREKNQQQQQKTSQAFI